MKSDFPRLVHADFRHFGLATGASNRIYCAFAALSQWSGRCSEDFDLRIGRCAMTRILGLLVLLAMGIGMGNAATAEIIKCHFDGPGQLINYLEWDNTRNIIRTKVGNPQKKFTYQNVKVRSDLKPYGKKGITLLAFDGDVTAIHLRQTNRARHGGKIYLYEAYWGKVPGRIDAGILELMLDWRARASKFGTRGVCSTNRFPPRDDVQRGGGEGQGRGSEGRGGCNGEGRGGKN